MRRIITTTLAALALAAGAFGLGGTVEPADAHVVQPYQTSYDAPGAFGGACPSRATYGNYGAGFAQVQLGVGCNVWSSVRVVTVWANGTVHEAFCNLLDEAVNDDPDCVWDIATNTIRVVTPGQAIGMTNYPCVDRTNGGPYDAFCVAWTHGVLGGEHRY